MLVAYLKANLLSGESVELLPIQHETDVKKEVSALLQEWVSSGFLIRERLIYPWHQVRAVEVSVEDVSQEETAQQMRDLHQADRARLHDDFWKGQLQR